jgi:gamma-butyrobetaine dioxygenase
MANDPAFRISFAFKPGLLLMMNNHRVLHGRTAFDHKQGHRLLEGCYMEHDGPDSLYRKLVRDGARPIIRGEVR